MHRTPPLLPPILVLFALAGCGGDGGGGGDPVGPGPGPGDPTPAIAVSATPTTLNLEAGDSVQVTAQVTGSGGFSGSVTVSAEGLPPGVTAAQQTVQVAGGSGSGTLRLVAASSAEPGSHTLTLRARASGVSDATASLSLALTAPPGDGGNGDGNGGGGDGLLLTVDFRACPTEQQPLWVAVSTGGEGWARVEGTDQVYTFEAEGTTGFAWYVELPVLRGIQVQYVAGEELTDDPIPVCDRGPFTVSGTVAGLSGTETGLVGMGGGSGLAVAAAPQVTLEGVHGGSQDLVAYRADAADPDLARERMLFRRGVSVGSGTTLGTVDFGGDEAFAPAIATFQVSGAESFVPFMDYVTSEACRPAPLYQLPLQSDPEVLVRGAPGARQGSQDLHAFGATGFLAGGSTFVLEQRWFRSLGGGALTLPPPPGVALERLSGPTLRIGAEMSIPAVFHAEGGAGSVSFLWEVPLNRRFQVAASFLALAELSGSAPGGSGAWEARLDMPDLSGAEGWEADWVLPSGASASTLVQVTATSLPAAPGAPRCAEGSWLRSAQRLGTTP